MTHKQINRTKGKSMPNEVMKRIMAERAKALSDPHGIEGTPKEGDRVSIIATARDEVGRAAIDHVLMTDPNSFIVRDTRYHGITSELVGPEDGTVTLFRREEP